MAAKKRLNTKTVALPLWERVVSSVSEKPGEGFSPIEKEHPSPGSNFASLILATLSHKGRGLQRA
jgi:hypothetical protein